MLAREDSVKEIFPESFIFNKPKDIVSGDFFWLYSDKNSIYLATVDCTGHGVPGAFMSVVSYRFLSQALRDHSLKRPSEILSYLNQEINSTLSTKANDPEAKNALDIALVHIDLKKKELEFSGVGQKMYMSTESELLEIKGDNFHIGQNLNTQLTPISTIHLELLPNSSLYMFSDGYIDQFGGPNEKRFGTSRFVKLLGEIKNLRFSEQRKAIESTFFEWKNGYEQVDDTLILGVKLF
jgi:serine phosphatase RsbU (regulator of sigma subunit)